jgi:cytochrome P450
LNADIFKAARQRICAIMKSGDLNGGANKTSVFHAVINSDMPSAEKTEDRLTIEAQIFLAAGTVTSARTIAMATYYILIDTSLRFRLGLELRDPMKGWPKSPPSMEELENLPLLQATVKEALRRVKDDKRFSKEQIANEEAQIKLRSYAPSSESFSR